MVQQTAKEMKNDSEQLEHLKQAFDNYISCLRRTTRNSKTSRAAASAVVRLWNNNRKHAHLSQTIERELSSGLAGKIDDFVPLAFQLTARLNSVTDSEGHAVDPLFCLEESLSQTEWQGPNGTQADDYSFGDGAGQTGQTLDDSGNVDQAAAAAAFQQALRALLVEISVTDSEGPQLVLYQLLAELADEETAGQGGGKGKAPAAAAAGSSPSKLAAAAVQQGRRSAATSLLQEIKQRVSEPAAIDATIAMAKALRSLAHCPNPPSMPKGGGRVSISDALSAAGISALQDVSQLSDLGHRIELVNVPPAVPSSLCEGVCLTRFLPYYVALPSGVPENVGGGGADSKDGAGSKLIWCEDESGTRHALLLKAGSAGTLDTRRDALVQQFVEEFNQLLNDEPHARKRGLKVRGRRVLPLAPSCALYEYRPHAVGMHTFLSAEHAAAYAAGGPKVKGAWERVRSGTSPLLHRFVLRCSPSPEAWLVRRLHLTRSLATSSIAGWLLGLGERAPHRLMLEQATAEVLHVGTQAILMQRPAAAAAAASTPAARAAPAPPFRLTRELVDALGPSGVDGPFRCAAEACLQTAQSEQGSAALLTLLEVFVDQPMTGWAAFTASMSAPWLTEGSEGLDALATLDAGVAIEYAKERFGVKGKSGHAPLSVESRVRQLISQATNEDVLASQPPGWRAWL